MSIAVIIPYPPTSPWYPRCRKSIDERFEVISVADEEGKGASAPRNEGLDRAFNFWNYRPDYVTFLDSDDEYAPDAYDQIEAAIKEAPDAPIIQLNHVLNKPDGTKWPRLTNRRGTYELDNLPRLWPSVCNKVFKAELIEDIRFKNGLRHGEDELFVLECLISARRIYNSERVALYYHNDNPESLSKSTTLDDLIGEQVALLEFIDEHREDKQLCTAVRIRQSELWSNAVYKRVLGGGKA